MANLEIVNEQPQEIDEKEKRRLARKAEKEAKRQRQYANSMITRAEAYQIAQDFSKKEVQNLVQFLREPIQASTYHLLALIDLLTEKGVFTEDEFQESLNKVAEKLQVQDGDSNDESKEDKGSESSSQETEEQQG